MQRIGSFLMKLWYLPVFLIAIPLYCINITYGDLWNDEIFTRHIITYAIPEMFHHLEGDFHPPLYFLVLKAFTAIAGSNVLSLRLFSVFGTIATLILVCTTGRRVFGKRGALLFCMMSMSIPMCATYSHTARMYTWASFAVTGVFLHACIAVRSPSAGNLWRLAFFTVLGAYVHYYCIIAAFCAHCFVLYTFIAKHARFVKFHLVTVSAMLVVYLPWLFTLFHQAEHVHRDYYLPPLSLGWISTCYSLPFFHDFYPVPFLSIPLFLLYTAVIIGGSVYLFRKRQFAGSIPLALSLIMFNGTILVAVIISLTVRNILLYRYVATMVTLLAVPPALLFSELRNRAVKAVLSGALLTIGIVASFEAGKQSMGEYRETLLHLKKNYPHVVKVLHINELTATPSLEYNAAGPWKHYWLENETTVYYTNLDVFPDLVRRRSLGEIVKHGERFCMINLPVAYNPLNTKNFDLVMSQCETLGADTLSDRRATVPACGLQLVLYHLRYRGKDTRGDMPTEETDTPESTGGYYEKGTEPKKR